MIRWTATSLAVALMALVGCGGDQERESKMELVGVYALDRDAVLQAYVDSRADAWPDLDPEARAREKSRLARAAGLSFEALQFDLELAEHGTFRLSRTFRMSGQRARTATGTWRASEGALTLRITHEDGIATKDERSVTARVEAGVLHLFWGQDLPTLVLRRSVNSL